MLIPLIVIALGLVFGSFITCMSWRWPREMEWVKTPSFCPTCNATLKPKDLFPLFSWLFSGGKCNHCKAPISFRYPLIEVTNALCFFLIYREFGFGIGMVVLCAMTVMLLIMIVVDFEHYLIPDQVHVALAPLALFYHYLIGDWDNALYGFLALTALGLSLHYGYGWIRKKDVLGFGDVKFLAVAGIWIGLDNVLPYIFAIGLIGTVMGIAWKIITKHPIYPFGPSLAVTLWLFIIYPNITNIFWNMIYSIRITL
jgi:leader peptidase (prepilin peptidase)/N-methyltransferase